MYLPRFRVDTLHHQIPVLTGLGSDNLFVEGLVYTLNESANLHVVVPRISMSVSDFARFCGTDIYLLSPTLFAQAASAIIVPARAGPHNHVHTIDVYLTSWSYRLFAFLLKFGSQIVCCSTVDPTIFAKMKVIQIMSSLATVLFPAKTVQAPQRKERHRQIV